MVHLILGLPGTGKTTRGNSEGAITLDLGGKNITPEGEKRLAKAFTEIIQDFAELSVNISFDTYDNYFDVDVIKELAKRGLVKVTVAIPKESDMVEIFENMTARGDDPEFINLYKKRHLAWIKEWNARWQDGDGIEVIDRYY